MKSKIKDTIKNYCQLQILAKSLINPTDELIEDIMHTEEEICCSFGIPPDTIESYDLDRDIMEYQARIDDYVDTLQARLSDFAEFYLLRTPQTNYQLLTNYKEPKFSFFIFRELGVLNHIYTKFLFEELFCTDQISMKEFIDEIEILKNNYQAFDLIGKIAGSNDKAEIVSLYELLLKIKLQFVVVFFSFYSKNSYVK